MNPSRCDDKWCNDFKKSNLPANGLFPFESNCGDLSTMLHQQQTTGGITGRGVTPCPFGYMQTKGDGKITVSPFNQSDTSNIFFEPNRPGWLPPQGNPRPLVRVGYTYRNS